MVITRIQYTFNKNTGSIGGSFSWPTPTTNNNFLIAIVVCNGIVNSVTSGYTEITNGGFTPNIKFYYYKNAPSQSIFGFTFSGFFDYVIYLIEYSGLDTTSPADANAVGHFFTGPPTTPSIITTHTDEVLVGILSSTGNDTYTSPTNGFTLIDSEAQFNSGSLAFLSAGLLEKIVSSTGTYSAGASASGSDFNTGIFSFFASSGGVSSSRKNMIRPRRGKMPKFSP